jgi:hypothetical protein
MPCQSQSVSIVFSVYFTPGWRALPRETQHLVGLHKVARIPLYLDRGYRRQTRPRAGCIDGWAPAPDTRGNEGLPTGLDEHSGVDLERRKK